PDGSVRGKWYSKTALSNPQSIAMDGADIWIADRATATVYRYGGAAGATTGTYPITSSFPLDSGNQHPAGLLTDGTTIWCTDNSAGKVFLYDINGKPLKPLNSWTLDPNNQDPEGIALNPNYRSSGSTTDLWVVDGTTLKA